MVEVINIWYLKYTHNESYTFVFTSFRIWLLSCEVGDCFNFILLRREGEASASLSQAYRKTIDGNAVAPCPSRASAEGHGRSRPILHGVAMQVQRNVPIGRENPLSPGKDHSLRLPWLPSLQSYSRQYCTRRRTYCLRFERVKRIAHSCPFFFLVLSFAPCLQSYSTGWEWTVNGRVVDR